MNPDMHNLLIGTIIGGTTGASFMLGEVLISGGTQLGIRDAITIGIFCCGMVMWLARKFQKIDDRLDTQDSKQTTIELKIDRLPCPGRNHPCE
jgi:hypothetical protein